MRLALDCRSVFEGRGGIGRYAECLAQRLPSLLVDEQMLLISTTKNKGNLSGSSQSQDLKVEAAMIDPLWEQLQLPTLLKDHDIDLYHNTCFSVPVVRTTRWAVATVHDVVFRAHPELVAPRLRTYLDTWTEHALDTADAIITVSAYSKQEIQKYYATPAEKIVVIPNGIDGKWRPATKKSISRLKEKFGLEDDYLLYVGSIEPKKNLPWLLDAMSSLAPTHPSLRLILAGASASGSNPLSEEISKRGLTKRVSHLGYVPEEDMIALMSGASVFVYPSLYEGFGLPPLEAMACGTACVVADATSLPEVVGEAALKADPKNPGSLADCLKRLLEDQARRKELQAAGMKHAATFTLDRMVKSTLDVYRSLEATGQ